MQSFKHPFYNDHYKILQNILQGNYDKQQKMDTVFLSLFCGLADDAVDFVFDFAIKNDDIDSLIFLYENYEVKYRD